MSIWLRYIASFVCGMHCAGCFLTTNPLLHKNKASLDFLEDGKTTKETVILKLGASFAALDGERILAYRLGKTNEGYVVIERKADVTTPERPAWVWLPGLEGTFDLMLVFDSTNVLQKHSLVSLN